MARTFGGGASDRLKVTNSTAINSLSALTIMCWVYRTGAGGGNFGRICDKRDTAATGSAAWYLTYDNSVTEYTFDTYRWSSVSGAWRTTGDAAVINTLHHLALTYSFSSTTNDAQFYINGSATGMEELSTPSGTVNSETVDLVIGNRNSNDRNWAGRLAEFSIHNRILSTREIAGAANKLSAAHFSGCVCYLPIIGRMSPEPNLRSRNNGVVTGTSQAAHPPIIAPRGRSFVPVTLNMYDLALDAGSYSLTGSTMSPEFGGVVGVESGIYTITGTPSSTRHAAVVGAEPGSYAITGTEPALLRDHIYQPASGVYTISGTAATFDITRPDAHELALDSGVYAIDGGAVGFIKDANLPVDSGVYTIAGQPATLLDSGSDDDEQHLLMLLGMGG